MFFSFFIGNGLYCSGLIVICISVGTVAVQDTLWTDPQCCTAMEPAGTELSPAVLSATKPRSTKPNLSKMAAQHMCQKRWIIGMIFFGWIVTSCGKIVIFNWNISIFLFVNKYFWSKSIWLKPYETSVSRFLRILIYWKKRHFIWKGFKELPENYYHLPQTNPGLFYKSPEFTELPLGRFWNQRHNAEFFFLIWSRWKLSA